MAGHHGSLKEYSPAQENWPEYIERLELYFIANDIVAPEKKRAILLNGCGPATYKLFRNLAAPNRPSDLSYDDLKQLMAQHTTPKPSIMVERFRFHSRAQNSVAEFVAQLRRLSEHCEFGATTKEMLRDRLVCGLADTSIQRKLLAEKDLTLDAALETARAMEAAEQNARTLRPAHASGEQEVNAVKRTSTTPLEATVGPTGGENARCTRCGGSSHTPAECRFRSAVCHACKKRGHLARMCRSRGRAGYRPPRQTHTVDQDPEGEESDTEDTYCLFNIRTKQKPITVNISADGKNLRMDLDTGAAVSVMSERTYHSLWPQDGPSLQPTTINLRTYTGEPIRIKGSISLSVVHNQQKLTLPIVVVEGSGPTLLGRDWLKELRLDWAEIFNIQLGPELVAVLDRHKAVFQDDLWGLRGTTAKIYVKPDVRPVFWKAHPVPHKLKVGVERELERLQKEGVVEPVRFSDWAAPIVPVVKTDGQVRICGDYRLTVNRASKREAYPLPKIEDLFTSMTGGVSFTKLDLRNAYQQIILEEESKNLTTINTHRGLFRYNRLPFGVASAPAIFQRTMDSFTPRDPTCSSLPRRYTGDWGR